MVKKGKKILLLNTVRMQIFCNTYATRLKSNKTQNKANNFNISEFAVKIMINITTQNL